tara:strand:- start:341 stop:937 length:597 start_codon:yes stop_codon:yes gene_type:complete
MNKIIGIFGKGGFSREIKYHILQKKKIEVHFISDFIDKSDKDIINIKDINKQLYDILLTQGDPFLRNKVYNQFQDLNYINYIHDYHNILDRNSVIIGNGSIICAGSILTTNITLGLCNHINLNSTIGHDTTLGNFVTCSPGVNISGNCKIGNNILIGTNSAIKEHISICDNVIIGMNSNVIKDIVEPGVYVGNPLRKL